MKSLFFSLFFFLLLSTVRPQPFRHPGLLQKDSDFERIRKKISLQAEPWVSGWKRLEANGHARPSYKAHPASVVYRGSDGIHRENYGTLYNDIAAAYALAIRWKISLDTVYANAAVRILNGWADSLVALGGSNDRVLAAGLYGYEIANAAEIMRTYDGWGSADFARFKNMMLTVFYPICHGFLIRNERCMAHFYANWDLCNMEALLAIGVLCDDRGIYNEAINYLRSGAGNGNLERAVNVIYPDSLGQWQESGRDQGHSVLGIGELGALCEMAWSQGDDLYGWLSNRFLKGAEYVAAYNLGDSVPYTPIANCTGAGQPVISAGGRGNVRPVWEMVYNHYVNRRGLAAPNCSRMAAAVRPEGGGGDYGPNSGGYDQLGYGTLLYTLNSLDPAVPAVAPEAGILIYPNPSQTNASCNWARLVKQ